MLTIPCPTCGLDLVFSPIKVLGDPDKLRDEVRLDHRHVHIQARPATCANGHKWELV